jgi:hypothetical protein
MNAILTWIEGTRVATTVAESATLTAWLSAVHVVGFALVTGAALVANLRALGALFSRSETSDFLVVANRAIALGLALSVATGAPLFAARAADAAANSLFQLKMLLLLGATTFQFAFVGGRGSFTRRSARASRVVSVVALALWLGLALAAFAFLLLE